MTEETTPKTRKPRVPNAERATVTLISPKGGEALIFIACKRKDGRYASYGLHKLVGEKGRFAPGKGRGSTQEHTDFAFAKKAIEKAAVQCEQLGWIRRIKRAGGPRPDAWGMKDLPAPTK